jgi:hypothetical protein
MDAMKSLIPLLIATLFALALAGAAGAAGAARAAGAAAGAKVVAGVTVVVTRPWVSLRGAPAETARAIALAYGNVTFQVEQRRGGWVQVRWKGERTLWLPGDAVEAEPAAPAIAGLGPAPTGPALPVQLPGPLEIPAMRLARAKGLQSAGYRREAREEYLAILALFPDTPQFYEAVRQMGFYYPGFFHPMAKLPPLRGTAPHPARMAQAEARLGPLLLEEGRTLLGEGRDLDAIAVYEMATLLAPSSRGAAEEGLREALGAYLGREHARADPREVDLMEATFRDYFPGTPLPRTAGGKGKTPELAARSARDGGR